MEKVSSERTFKDSLAELFRCLYDLAVLRSVRRGEGSTVESEKKYSPRVECILDLCNHIKGWEIASQDIYERDGYVAQLWTDRCTCNRVVVILKQNCKKDASLLFMCRFPRKRWWERYCQMLCAKPAINAKCRKPRR